MACETSESGFRLLFACNPQPMWVYDIHTLAFLEVNDAATDRYGYTRDEFLRMRITDIRPGEDAGRVAADARRARPSLQYSGEWRHRRKDGAILDVDITSHTLEFAGREAALVVARDVTERRRLERRTRDALTALLATVEAVTQLSGEANRRMDTFLGIAGHEMRTPLTTIKGNLQLAHRRLQRLIGRVDLPGEALREAEEALRLLERTDGGVSRISLLVNDILDTSRIQAGQLRIRPRPCDLADLVREVVDEQRTIAAPRTIRMEMAPVAPVAPGPVHCPGTAGVSPASSDGGGRDARGPSGRAVDFSRTLPVVPVVADAERIGQVLTNYLSNALKYSPQDRPVVVGLIVDGDTARVFVRDKGPGIAPAQHESIWERFYRVEADERLHGSSVGLGLGLYISRMIVEQHEGRVGVESAPGAGATFWFTLPLKR